MAINRVQFADYQSEKPGDTVPHVIVDDPTREYAGVKGIKDATGAVCAPLLHPFIYYHATCNMSKRLITLSEYECSRNKQ